MGNTIVKYGESEISVSKEVADFLEADRKRQAAEGRSDRRHTSKSDSETVLQTAHNAAFSDPTFMRCLKTSALKNCKKLPAALQMTNGY